MNTKRDKFVCACFINHTIALCKILTFKVHRLDWDRDMVKLLNVSYVVLACLQNEHVMVDFNCPKNKSDIIDLWEFIALSHSFSALVISIGIFASYKQKRQSSIFL